MRYLKLISYLHSEMDKAGLDPVSWEIRSLPVVNSTNDYVERMFKLNTNKTIVISVIQEEGRGRGINSWDSKEGGIWLSIGYKDSFPVIELSTPVVEAVHSVLNKIVKCEIKAPNDILIKNKKICGILVEANISGNYMSEVIVGIGINVINDVSDDLKEIATSISDYVNNPDLNKISSDVVIAVIRRLEELDIC